MVVDDLDVFGVVAGPSEADAPLVIDANTVLSRALTTQLLQPIARRDSTFVKADGGINEDELSEHDSPQIWREPADGLTRPAAFRVAVGEASEHVE